MAETATDVTKALDAAAAFLTKRLRDAKVMLFGSHVHGVADEWSDIDIAVFSPDVAGMGLMQRVRLATELQLACGLELEPHFFPDTYLDNPPEASFAKHIVETGRRIV